MASNENDPAVLTYLGYSQRKLGNIDLGISLYKRALDIDPDNVDTREYLGEGYVSKGELDLAWLELVEIEKRCGTTCVEYRALEKALQSGTLAILAICRPPPPISALLASRRSDFGC